MFLTKPHQGPIRCKHARGFTLLELLVVAAIVAIALGLVVLSLPSADGRSLEQQATRLAAALDSARAVSRASGLVVLAKLERRDDVSSLVFEPQLPTLPSLSLPRGMNVELEVEGGAIQSDRAQQRPLGVAKGLRLGPEPLMEPTIMVLSTEAAKITVATDGLRQFSVRSFEPNGDTRR